MARKKIVIAGAFDPICPSHVEVLQKAKRYGAVHVLLHSDAWLIRKKGFCFQSFTDRQRLLDVYAVAVHAAQDADGTVSRDLKKIRPHFFVSLNGDGEAFPEAELCKTLNIEVPERLSSLALNSSMLNSTGRVITRWGYFDVLIDMPKLKVKLLHLEAGKSLSLQKHRLRTEFFFMPNGEVRMNVPGTWHVLRAPKQKSLTVVEVQIGASEEDDAERISEKAKAFASEVTRRIDLNQ